MSKIICDVCGTAYAENAAQCPICGSAKRADSNMNSAQGEAASYQFVKGGRFSKKNVKKRNKENQANKAAQKRTKPAREEEREHSGISKGLMILLLLLIAAALALLIYIGLKFFMPGPNVPDTTPPGVTDTTPTTEPNQTETGQTDPTTQPTETDPQRIPCQGIMLQEARIVLENVGETSQIKVNLLPADSTDPIEFKSMNEQVALVDEYGYVVAVGHGETKVQVSCGSFTVNCEVRVNAPATEPSTEPTTEPTEPDKIVELNRADITMFYEGETWRLYIGTADLDEVTWSTDDEKVAVFERGTVKAVGPGETVVYAEYGDQKVGCIIRCNWEPEETQEPTEPTDPTEPEIEPGLYVMHINGDLPSELYGADVSLGIGDSFTLTVVSPSGKTVNVDWTADEDGVVSIDGNTITGAGSGVVYVSAVYNDQTFVCIVRVS